MSRLSPSRRRQRSVRVTVAVSLLGAGTAAVVVALAVATVAALSVASVLSLLCGWAAARIIWTELAQSRRFHAQDRAAQARDFRELFVQRSAEHAAFASAVTDRLVARDRDVRELEGTLRLSERRATDAEDRVRREARRAHEAQQRVAELETALAIRTAEEADELASWSATGGMAEMDTVVDLLSWEDRGQPVAERKRA
jgi:Skp family chaperone for outer membrane proteins